MSHIVRKIAEFLVGTHTTIRDERNLAAVRMRDWQSRLLLNDWSMGRYVRNRYQAENEDIYSQILACAVKLEELDEWSFYLTQLYYHIRYRPSSQFHIDETL